MLPRIETRTREMLYCQTQTIRTVRDISRDDRARIATCSLRTPTSRLKENCSIIIDSIRHQNNDNLPQFVIFLNRKIIVSYGWSPLQDTLGVFEYIALSAPFSVKTTWHFNMNKP